MGVFMRGIRKALAHVLFTATAGALTVSSALAACPMSGQWHLFIMQGNTPGVRTQLYNVGDATNTGAVGVIGFPTSGAPFDNATANVIKCRILNMNANGQFTNALCTSYGVVAGDGGNVFVSGRVITNLACQITGGTINVPEDLTVTLLGGYINGAYGAGIGRQGGRTVLSFNMIKVP
jgi:hypothetical protein